MPLAFLFQQLFAGFPVESDIDFFGGMIKVPVGYKEPILVSGADGVGTKLNICMIANDYTTIGQDLVAMCVNDVITCGAKPLYFLDYISTKKLDGREDEIMKGIIKGCEIAGVELIGGETAEHGRFARDIDLAGFCTGIVEERTHYIGYDRNEYYFEGVEIDTITIASGNISVVEERYQYVDTSLKERYDEGTLIG